jgi:hypothetical protein
VNELSGFINAMQARGPALLPPEAEASIRPSSIDWVPRDQRTVNEHGHVTIGHYGGWRVQIWVMLVNERLCLMPPDDLVVPDYAWCYPKGGVAHLSALLWEPETEPEPMGFVKQATMLHGRPRRAGEHAEP